MLINKKSGTFLAHDLLNNPVILEWEEIQGQTERLSEKIKSLSPILVPTYAHVETEFARNKPEEVPHDFMLKSLTPFIAQNPIDTNWDLFQEKTTDQLQQFFTTWDWNKGSGTHDIHFFVTIKDQNSESLLGVIQFFNTPQFAPNTCKVALYGVLPSAHNRGLEQLLMSSIFNLNQYINRLFLHTRSTNKQAICMYQSWGFTQFVGTLPNWPDFEYVVGAGSDTLQKSAKLLVLQS